jgi:hypothetical protein
MLIAVLDWVAASANSSNIDITYSDKYGGKRNYKFIIAAYLHVVTNVQIHYVTHKYIVLGHINEGDSCYYLVQINNKRSLKSGLVLFRHSMLQLLEMQGRTESHSKFTIGR